MNWLRILSQQSTSYGCRGHHTTPAHLPSTAVAESAPSEVQFVGTGREMRPPPRAISLITQTSALHTAFSQISSTLTQTLTSTARPGLAVAVSAAPVREVELERWDEWKDDRFNETVFTAHKMTLDIHRDPPSFNAQLSSECLVRLRDMPFEQGGERNAYHLFIDEVDPSCTQLDDEEPEFEHFIAKESRLVENFKDRLRFHVVSLSIW
jgi:hypothetical protein